MTWKSEGFNASALSMASKRCRSDGDTATLTAGSWLSAIRTGAMSTPAQHSASPVWNVMRIECLQILIVVRSDASAQ